MCGFSVYQYAEVMPYILQKEISETFSVRHFDFWWSVFVALNHIVQLPANM